MWLMWESLHPHWEKSWQNSIIRPFWQKYSHSGNFSFFVSKFFHDFCQFIDWCMTSIFKRYASKYVVSLAVCKYMLWYAFILAQYAWLSSSHIMIHICSIVQGEYSKTQWDNRQDAFGPPLWCIHNKYQFLVFFIIFSDICLLKKIK